MVRLRLPASNEGIPNQRKVPRVKATNIEANPGLVNPVQIFAIICKTSHPPCQCPAFGKTCYKCNKKGHYAKCCRSNTTTNSGYTKPGFDRQSHKSVNEVKMYDTDSETYVYDSVVIKCRVRFVDQSTRNNIIYIKVSLKQNSYFLLRDKLSPGTNPGFLKSEKMLCFIYLYTPRCIRKYLCSLF